MKRKVLILVLASMLATSMLGCGSSKDKENAELQAQLEEMQAELDALKQESEEVVEESSEEESTEESVEESTEEAPEESTEEAKNTPANNADVSADWTSYSFSVNGKTLTLPCSYQELAEATGFAMKSSNAKSYLEGGYYTNVNLYTEDEDLALYIDILNDTDGDLTYAECKVVAISQTKYQAVECGASMITFAGGLQVGQEMTTDDIEAIFGEPQDTYEYVSDDSDYCSSEWTYSEDPDYTYHNNIEITIVNGLIDEIGIEHLNF